MKNKNEEVLLNVNFVQNDYFFIYFKTAVKIVIPNQCAPLNHFAVKIYILLNLH